MRSIFFASLAWLATIGCGAPAPDAADAAGSDAGAPDARVTDDAALDADLPIDPAPACELAPAPLLRPFLAADVAVVTSRSVFLGDPRGLFRADDVGAPFARLATLPVQGEGERSMVALDDGAILVATSGYSGRVRVFESRDDGATWDEHALELPSLLDGAGLLTDGSRVIAAGSPFRSELWVHELDRAARRFVPLEAAPPLVDPPSPFIVHPIGFDRGALVAEHHRNPGLYRLEPGATHWEEIPGIGEWGYETFLGDATARLTTNSRGVLADLGGTWTLVADRPTRGLHLSRGSAEAGTDETAYVALDATALLRSSDGLTWESAPFTPLEGEAVAQVSRAGDRLAVTSRTLSLYDARTHLSADLGATWSAPDVRSEATYAVHADGGATYASDGSWYELRDGTWSELTWPDSIYPGSVAFTRDGAWQCLEEGCAFRDHAGALGERIALPESHPVGGEAFVAGGALFFQARSYGTSCGTLQPPLLRLELSEDGRAAPGAEWVDASAGVPFEALGGACTGERRYRGLAAIVELGDVLLAGAYLTYTFDPPPILLRSTDGGLHWEEIAQGDRLLAAVRAGDEVFALLDPQGVVVSRDEARTFAPAPSQPPGTITDLVQLEGRLVASTLSWAGPSLWVSADGARSWWPLETERADEIGPVTALDADGARLAIASRTSGTWEASGCF